MAGERSARPVTGDRAWRRVRRAPGRACLALVPRAVEPVANIAVGVDRLLGCSEDGKDACDVEDSMDRPLVADRPGSAAASSAALSLATKPPMAGLSMKVT